MIKKYITFFLMLIALTLPVMAEEIPDNATAIDSTATENSLPSKTPYSRKALAMKFILAMLGVGASSVIIYVGLSVYNRFIYGTPAQKHQKTEDEEYKTPNNMKDAIEIFLRKTK